MRGSRASPRTGGQRLAHHERGRVLTTSRGPYPATVRPSISLRTNGCSARKMRSSFVVGVCHGEGIIARTSLVGDGGGLASWGSALLEDLLDVAAGVGAGVVGQLLGGADADEAAAAVAGSGTQVDDPV